MTEHRHATTLAGPRRCPYCGHRCHGRTCRYCQDLERAERAVWRSSLGDDLPPLSALVRLVSVGLAIALAGGVAGARARTGREFPTPPAWWLHGPGACVRQWESGNGRTSPNLYGMLDGWAAAGGRGSAARASRFEQDYRAFILWKRYGWEPWRGQTATKCGLSW